MRKLAIAIGLTVAVVSGACALMPERWAVNAPLLHLVFGRGAAPEEEGFSERIGVPEGSTTMVFSNETVVLPGAAARSVRVTTGSWGPAAWTPPT